MKQQRLTDGVKLVAFGYLLLHLNINLGTLNVLPNWLGYLLMLKALPELSEYERSSLLLRPIGILLALWEGILWLAATFGYGVEGQLIGVIATVIALYFHFQLLTNLADIAERFGCPERGRIFSLRTVRTVLTTLFALPVAWENHRVLTICMVIIHIVVAIWICSVLFSFRHSLCALD